MPRAIAATAAIAAAPSGSGAEKSAVDRDGLAGDERGGFGGEEHHEPRDIVLFGEAAERDARNDLDTREANSTDKMPAESRISSSVNRRKRWSSSRADAPTPRQARQLAWREREALEHRAPAPRLQWRPTRLAIRRLDSSS
jgi:hypothetical protein